MTLQIKTDVFPGLPVKTSENQIKETLTAVVIRTIKEIADQAFQAEQQFYDPKVSIEKKVTLLKEGCWYGNDYYNALSHGIKNFSVTTHKTAFLWCIQQMSLFKNKNYFYTSHLSDQHFSRKENSKRLGGYECNYFSLKESTLPSDALKAARQGLSLIDCTIACQIAHYQALLEVLGTKKFNKHFSAFKLQSVDDRLYVKELHLQFNQLERAPRLGEWVWFKNHNLYTTKHLMGDSTGFHLICTDATRKNQRFVGLGLSTEGLSIEKMNQKLIDAYNSDPIGNEQLTKKRQQKLIKTSKEVQVTWELDGDKIDISQFEASNLLSKHKITELPPITGLSPVRITFSLEKVMNLLKN